MLVYRLFREVLGNFMKQPVDQHRLINLYNFHVNLFNKFSFRTTHYKARDIFRTTNQLLPQEKGCWSWRSHDLCVIQLRQDGQSYAAHETKVSKDLLNNFVSFELCSEHKSCCCILRLTAGAL